MTINEMIHEIPHMRYRLESTKHKETLDEIEEVLRHHKEINEVLDKIRAEIDNHCSNNRDRNDGLYIAMKIIDKYKIEKSQAEKSQAEIDYYNWENEILNG